MVLEGNEVGGCFFYIAKQALLGPDRLPIAQMLFKLQLVDRQYTIYEA